MLTTARLILRGYRESDLPDVLKAWNDFSVIQNMTIQYPVPMDSKKLHEIMERITRFLVAVTKDEKRGADLNQEGEFVGIVTVICEPPSHDGSFSIMVAPSAQGKGYGTEMTEKMIEYSFEWMNLHRLELGTYEWNETAIKLYKRLGFVEEGRMRKKKWARGAWHDVINMAILEEDWRAGKKKIEDRLSEFHLVEKP